MYFHVQQLINEIRATADTELADVNAMFGPSTTEK